MVRQYLDIALWLYIQVPALMVIVRHHTCGATYCNSVDALQILCGIMHSCITTYCPWTLLLCALYVVTAHMHYIYSIQHLQRCINYNLITGIDASLQETPKHAKFLCMHLSLRARQFRDLIIEGFAQSQHSINQ